MANGFAIESAIDPGCSGINVFFKAVLYLAKWLSLTRVRNSGLTEAEPAGISRTTIVVNAFIGGAHTQLVSNTRNDPRYFGGMNRTIANVLGSVDIFTNP